MRTWYRSDSNMQGKGSIHTFLMNEDDWINTASEGTTLEDMWFSLDVLCSEGYTVKMSQNSYHEENQVMLTRKTVDFKDAQSICVVGENMECCLVQCLAWYYRLFAGVVDWREISEVPAIQDAPPVASEINSEPPNLDEIPF